MNIAVCLSLFLLSLVTDLSFAEKCSSVKSSNTKLFCYYGKLKDVDSCKCSHVILPPNSDVKSIERLRSKLTGVKILVTVHEFNEGLVDLLKKTKIDGLEVDLKKLESKTDIADFISTARSKLGSDLYTAVSVPVRTDLLAKFYDFKGLSKNVDSFILQTAFLGASTNITFHPSRLSGLWDMQNADSVVDLMVGLGAPLSKLVIAAPVQAFQFTLQDEKHTAPGSPAVEVKSITRDELCGKMAAANWTLERDQDQAGPYIFRKQEWIAFDDPTSIDIKAKYARVRGLAGLALKDLSQDGGAECGGTLLEAAYNGLSKQSRAPRGAVLQSLEREILTPSRPLDNIRVSPYRITRIIDTEGKIHAVRQDTRTEFECSRQGYFVHPRSCNRFYRCVKFDQHTDEFNVFEFDCPAGLAFDSKVEVCVWPGSLSDGSACSGSSEIAPVPKNRFVCPHEAGYYADPENCRWFFACLDHGQSAPTAYEFRCPFGLVFDQDRLMCEWPWLVPKCAHGYGSGVLVEFHGGAYGTHGGALGVNAAIDAYRAFGQGDGHGNLAGVQRGQLILGNYNGLGILQPVTLGGLHGPIEEPVSKVYSSFSENRGGHDGSILLGAGRGTNIDGGLGQIGAIGRNDQRGSIKYQGAGHSGLIGDIEGQRILSTTVDGHGIGDGQVLLHQSGGSQAGHGDSLSYQEGHLSGLDGNLGKSTVTYHGNLRGGDKHVLLDGNVGSVGYQGIGQSGSKILSNSDGQAILHQGLIDGSQASHEGYLGGNLGKSTVTYHGNFGGDSSRSDEQALLHGVAGNVGGIGIIQGLDDQRGSIKYQGDDYSGSNGVIEGQRILSTTVNDGSSHGGLDGSSINYQGHLAGLDGDSGKSTVTYHGNLGGDGQVLVHGIAGHVGQIGLDDQRGSSKFQSSGSLAGDGLSHQNGVVFLENGGLVQDGDAHFGQRGSSKFQSTGLSSDGGRSTVTYHGNLGKSNRIGYSVNKSPIDRASLVFGTKLRGSSNRGDVEGLKLTQQQVLIGGHDGVNQDGQQGYTATFGSGVAAGDNIGHNIVTYHGDSGDNIGILNTGVSSHGPTEKNLIDASRGSVKYQQDGGSTSYQNFNREKSAGRVNIVGGGFSAVGVYPNTYKQTTPQIQTVTAAPVSVTPHIPVVTSVPIPTTHSSDTLDVYNGNGVVANVPELQVKVQHHGEAIIPNIQQAHTATTGEALDVVNGGYVYDKPSLQFVDGAKSFVHQKIEHHTPIKSVVPVAPNSGEIGHREQEVVFQSGRIDLQDNNQYPSGQGVGVESVTPSLLLTEQKIEFGNYQPSIVFKQPRQRVEVSSTVRPKYLENVTPIQPVLIENVTPSVNYATTLVENVTPSVSIHSNGEEEVSTVRPATSYNQIHHHVQGVTPILSQNIDVSYDKRVTPSILVGPVAEQNGGIKSPPLHTYSSIRFGTSIGPQQDTLIHQPVVQSVTPVSVVHQPIIGHKVTSGSITSIPTASFSYQNLGAGGFEKQDLIHQGVVENVTPVSVVHQPVIEHKVTSGSITSIPTASLSYQNLGAGGFEKQDLIHQGVVENVTPVSVGHQPIIEHKVTSGSITSIPTASLSYQNLGAAGFEKQDLIHQGVVENVTPVSVGHQPIIEHKITSGSITSIPTASFSYQNLGARGFEKQDFSSVTPSSVVVQQPDLHSTFLSAISKSRGFSKSDAEIPHITPSLAYKENLIPSQKATGQNVYLGHVGGNIEFGKFGIQQIVPEGNVYHGGEGRGFVKYTQSVTPTPETLGPQIDLGGHQNLYGTFQQFGLKNNLDQYQGRKESGGYHYAKPTIAFNEEPNYEGLEPVKEEPFVAKKAYVTGHGNGLSNVVYEENYSVTPSPVIPVVSSTPAFVTSTVRPSYQSTIQSVYNTIPSTSVKPLNYYYHDSRYSSTPKPFEIKSSVTPIVPINRPQFVVSTTPAPTVSITPVEIHPELTPITQSKPIFKYSFNSFDHQYSSSPHDIDVESIVTPLAVKSTTPLPLPEIVTLQPTRAYLPPVGIVEDYRAPILKNRKIVKVVRPPTSQAIVKVNDFHPLLSAKLGAQCTCITDAVRFRNKPVKVKIDDGETVEEFVVNPNNGIGDIEGESIKGAYAVPQYEPQVVVDVTPVPEVTIGSTTPILISKPPLVVRKRVRVRPLQSTTSTILEAPVSKISDIFLKSTAVPNYQLTDDQILTGVKSSQALTAHNFDRYGPGGLRSKTETLQGTIDCQRAGLFRHPTQCNKFYSCRWDCNKNKFTLHVFNCPVHLTFDDSLGACNWPSQGPTCLGNTLLPSD